MRDTRLGIKRSLVSFHTKKHLLLKTWSIFFVCLGCVIVCSIPFVGAFYTGGSPNVCANSAVADQGCSPSGALILHLSPSPVYKCCLRWSLTPLLCRWSNKRTSNVSNWPFLLQYSIPMLAWYASMPEVDFALSKKWWKVITSRPWSWKDLWCSSYKDLSRLICRRWWVRRVRLRLGAGLDFYRGWMPCWSCAHSCWKQRICVLFSDEGRVFLRFFGFPGSSTILRFVQTRRRVNMKSYWIT